MRKLLLIFSLLFFLSSCVRKQTLPPRRIAPRRRVRVFTWPITVRVKIHEFRRHLKFHVEGDVYINGESLLPDGNYSVKLKRVKASTFNYYEILMKSSSFRKANEFYKSLERGSTGKKIFFVDVGTIYKFGSITVDNRKFYVLRGPYNGKKARYRMYVEPVTPPHATLILFNDYGEKIKEFQDSLSLTTDNGMVNIGTYEISGGRIIITVDTKGRGTVIFETDIEDYIKRVLPAEMPMNFPVEALKAQSVVARTFALSNLGKFYRYQPYDFTSTVTSQVFQGKKYELADSVVNLTRGIVLFYGDRLAQVYYHSTCGGHTEDVTCIWGGEEIPYLKGVKDGNFNLNLRDPVEVRIFIYSPPQQLLCNLTDNAAILPYVERNFRWKVVLARKKVEKLVKKYTGKGIGKLLSITPIKRGVSGRITEIVISGTKRSVKIVGEYKIRKVFGGLKSSLFVIDYLRDDNGNVVNVIFNGGGAGHGVGMCQVGAGILADKGFKMKDIIKHYFPGVKGVKLY